jgi:hypothetical protein
MKRFFLVLSFLAVSLLLSETATYAQRGRGGGGNPGGGVGRGAPLPTPAPANRGNSANAPNNNASSKSDAPKAAAKEKNKVADELHLNPKLEDQVKTMLPSNMSVDDASAGFKNRGQFISALHVSKNLGIPFGDLRSRMTGDQSMSLGKAIETLKPDLGKTKANDEAKRGEREAKDTEKKFKS